MPKSKHIGTEFGHLTVIEVAEVQKTPAGASRQIMRCRCRCGRERHVALNSLTAGTAYKCQVCMRGGEHGYDHPLYSTWRGILNRCRNSECPQYPYYGGRGIDVCDRWYGHSTLTGFNAFVLDMGPRPPGLTIDRKDNYKGYEPGNCQWATRHQQANNRSDNVRATVAGEDLTLTEWSELLDVSTKSLSYPLDLGYSLTEVVTAYLKADGDGVQWTASADRKPYVRTAPRMPPLPYEPVDREDLNDLLGD